MRIQFRRLGFIVLGSVILPMSLGAQGWWLEGGPVFRGGMRVNVKGSSYAQQLGLHDPLATGPLASPPGIGSVNAYGDRTYDDGYVKMDPGTGNPASPDPNSTWYWGYNNAGQYDSGSQTLSFHKQGAPGYATLADRPTAGGTEMFGSGFQLVVGLPLRKSARSSISLTLGLQAIWANTAKLRFSPYREDVRQTSVTDTYNVSGIPPGSFPAAGHQGTYLGPFDNPPVIPSPVIPNDPAARSASTSAALATAEDAVSFEIDQRLYELSIGPQFDWQVGSRLKLNLRPTISLNIIDMDVRRTEVFQSSSGGVLNRWSDRRGECAVLPGLGITGGVEIGLGRGFYVGAFGGYEWVIQDAHVTVGPNTVSLNASGFIAGAVLGKRF